MKILVTGAKGFIGRNLTLVLQERGHAVLPFDITDTEADLENYLASAEWVFHLAGVNRPKSEDEFASVNAGLTETLIDILEKRGIKVPIIFASSTQAVLENPYGRSKKAAEDALLAFSARCGNPVYVFRLYNVFGKWCRPNYNSVIATFCHNVANGLPLEINESAPKIDFVYIDDVVKSFLACLSLANESTGILYPEPHYNRSLNEIASLLYSYRDSRTNGMVPNIAGEFEKKLYSTYLSYLPKDAFSYPLDMKKDERGSFTEILRTIGAGQFSVNVCKPGITKGNHYHHTKNEKYLVVSGEAEIKLRKVDEEEIIVYRRSSRIMEVVDIPCGYTHSIKNVGDDDLVTFMWANECFDPDNPDTIFCPVEQNQ